MTTPEAPTDILLPALESALKISVSSSGPTKEISVVRVDGVVDTMTAGELDRVISSLVARGRHRLVVDLAGVEYISSAGWGVFVSYLREIREHAGDLKLARMTPDVREIYELLEFDGLLPAYDRLEAAEAGFFGSRSAVSGAPESLPMPIDTGAASGAKPSGTGAATPDAVKELTIEQAISHLVTEDPFYSISEISRCLEERYNGRFHVGWWKVFACLRRQRLLTRRARFRHFRRARRTA
jgi:anti-sigma B factor antagonist